jgi:ribosome-binding factor A
MFVGVLRLAFHIPAARSLKDKRRVVQKVRDRIRSRFDVSIAEVEAQDLHQRAVFGVSVVSSDAAVCDSVLARVADAAESVGDAVLTDRTTEIVTMGKAYTERAMAAEENNRARRVGESVRAEIASLLATQVKDPRAVGAVLTRVDMAGDLRSAVVYVRLLQDGSEARRRVLVGALRRASGLMRREIAHRLGLRHAPELRFVYDDGVDDLDKVERLLDEIAGERGLGERKPR